MATATMEAPTLTAAEMEKRIVRYGDLKPCKTAFIDAHTPGSNQKENFTVIGGGVSESPDQHVHIKETPGFNIGAAGQPPKCRNSLHSHRTAEVFFVLKGRWRFFWGRWGNAGEVVLEEGDIFNIPTGIFRGFENIGTDYGMIMAILGGDDAGGGVIWAPQVITDAKDHGLVLGENGKLYDEAKAEVLKGIECLEFGCSLPNIAAGEQLDVSRGVRCETTHEPLGIVAGVVPFNFPFMVPLWMMPQALVGGNCFVLKPSEVVPLSPP